jgi:hypothetical protein
LSVKDLSSEDLSFVTSEFVDFPYSIGIAGFSAFWTESVEMRKSLCGLLGLLVSVYREFAIVSASLIVFERFS